MLTRSKKGMVVVTKRSFAKGQARKTLIGELVVQWESANGNADVWTDWKDVSDGKAVMIGPDLALEANMASLSISSA